MAAYVVAELEITDPAGFQEYRGGVPATIEQYGGRYIVRGGKIELLEGNRQPERLTIIEFSSAEQARAWWESREYRDLKQLRQRTATTNLMIVEGV